MNEFIILWSIDFQDSASFVPVFEIFDIINVFCFYYVPLFAIYLVVLPWGITTFAAFEKKRHLIL